MIFFVSARHTQEATNVGADALSRLLTNQSFEKVFENTRKLFSSFAEITPESVFRYPNVSSVADRKKVTAFRVGANVMVNSKKSMEQICDFL